jgi:hypothetical protein
MLGCGRNVIKLETICERETKNQSNIIWGEMGNILPLNNNTKSTVQQEPPYTPFGWILNCFLYTFVIDFFVIADRK